MPGKSGRGLWILALFLLLMWVGASGSTFLLAEHPTLGERVAVATQMWVAVGIGSFDLIVLWLWIGVWEHRTQLRDWMREAFSSRRAVMLVCPNCGFKPSNEETAAQRLLRERAA